MDRLKRSKLILLISLISIVLFFVIIYLLIFHNYFEENNARKNVELVSSNIIHKIHGLIFSIDRMNQDMSFLLETAHYNKEDLDVLLKEIVSTNNFIKGALIILESYPSDSTKSNFATYYFKQNDSITFHSLVDSTNHYLDKEYYLLPKDSGKTIWFEPEFNNEEKEVLISRVSTPVYKNENGRHKVFKCIFAVDINLNLFIDYLRSFENNEQMDIFIISGNGNYLYSTVNQHLIDQSIFAVAKKYKSKELNEFAQKMIKGETGLIKLTDVFHKDYEWLYYAPIHDTKWSIGIFFK